MLEAGRLARGERDAPLICGVVKADAFGVGVESVARCLDDAGIDMLAVYSPEQAAPLAELNLRCPLLLLMPTLGLSLAPALQLLAKKNLLHITVHHESQLHDVNAVAAALGCQIPIHLMLDTGMSRAGVSVREWTRMVNLSLALKNVRLAGLYTHMASPDTDTEFTRAQAAKFDRAVEACIASLPNDVVLHIANTFATLTDHAHHRQMIRVGLGLYGYGPESLQPGTAIHHANQIQPIVRWMSRIVHVQRHAAGTPVGYNSTHRLTRDSVLGLVPVGYADGYPRALSNLGAVELCDAIHHRQISCAVLGRVNMDQIVIDLTDAPEADARLGDEVEIYSNRNDATCAVPRLAALANTNCYEMLCRLSPRIQRVYV